MSPIQRRALHRARISSLCAVGVAVLLGCSGVSPPKATHVDSVQKAASIHVAPISIARWEDYTDLLQPQFPMSAATALGLALPKTFISQNNFASLSRAGLQVGLPQLSGTSTLVQSQGQAASAAQGLTNVGNQGTTSGNTTTTGGSSGDGSTSSNGSTGSTSTTTTSTTSAGNNSSTTQTTTTQLGPGTPPANPLPALAAPNAGGLVLPTGTLQNDAMTTYVAATAIYQEITLLNNYLHDAALRRHFVPYLARVQVSLSPYAHGLPYDTYVNLSFFGTCDGGKTFLPAMAVPLLVTDDVETGQASSAVDIARQLALSLGGAIGNVGVQGQLANLKDEFKSILSTDFNSLYMVTRANDNTLQVRLGAARNTASGYAMLTQTHNVTFVLLVDRTQSPDESECRFVSDHFESGRRVPATAPQVLMNSFARLRESTTGEELPVDRQYIRDHVVAALRRTLPPDDATADKLSYEKVSAIAGAVQSNNVDRFAAAYCAALPSTQDRPCSGFNSSMASAWAALASTLAFTEFTGTYLELPTSGRQAVSSGQLATPRSEAVFLHDDCKAAATVQVASIGQLPPNQIEARLVLSATQAAGTASLDEHATDVTISATSVAQAAAGAPYTIQFPSFKPFGGLKNVAANGAFATACPADKAKPDPPAPPAKNKPKIVKPAPAPVESTKPPTFAQATSVRLYVREKGNSRWTDPGQVPSRFQDVYATIFIDDAAKPQSASVSMTPTSQVIAMASDGTGQIRLQLKLGDGGGVDDGVLSFSGAALASASANAVVLQKSPEPASTLQILKSGYVDVKLQGMSANQLVTITLTGRHGGDAVASANVIVPVVSRAAPTRTAGNNAP